MGGGSGGGSAVSQLPLPSAPCSDGAPARLCVQGTRSEPSVAPGSEPTSVVRSSRLLLAFTKRTVGGELKPRPPPPPPESIAGIEGKRLEGAKHRIHKVILTLFPTCRRLGVLRDDAGGADDFTGDVRGKFAGGADDFTGDGGDGDGNAGGDEEGLSFVHASAKNRTGSGAPVRHTGRIKTVTRKPVERGDPGRAEPESRRPCHRRMADKESRC